MKKTLTLLMLLLSPCFALSALAATNLTDCSPDQTKVTIAPANNWGYYVQDSNANVVLEKNSGGGKGSFCSSIPTSPSGLIKYIVSVNPEDFSPRPPVICTININHSGMISGIIVWNPLQGICKASDNTLVLSAPNQKS